MCGSPPRVPLDAAPLASWDPEAPHALNLRTRSGICCVMGLSLYLNPTVWLLALVFPAIVACALFYPAYVVTRYVIIRRAVTGPASGNDTRELRLEAHDAELAFRRLSLFGGDHREADDPPATE